MPTLDLQPRSPERARLLDAARGVSAVLCLGFLAVYAFFAALGAFTPGEVAGVTAAAVFALALWVVHAVADRRAGRDPDAISARERRGF